MIMLHIADARPAIRQNLATGRVSERITGRGLAIVSATLSAQVEPASAVPLAARFLGRAEGFFAFSLFPDRDLPDFSAATNVRLRAEFRFTERDALVAERVVPASALVLQDAQRSVAGRNVTVRVIGGAPIDLSVETDPAAVALQGIVLRNHDPAQPVQNVQVAAGPANATTDVQGRFFLPALPLQASVTLVTTENGNTTNSTYHIDYERPVNSVTLSLPG